MSMHLSDRCEDVRKVVLPGSGLDGSLRKVRHLLAQQGAVAAGALRAGPIPPAVVSFYRSWLAAGHAASLGYLGRHLEPRFDTSHAGLLKEATIVICAAFPYADGARADGLWSLVACHARGIDYHVTLRNKLAVVAGEIERTVMGSRCRVVVDSAPVLERSLAVACGLGVIGRSGMLLVPGIGPRVLLGEIVCSGVPADQAVPWPETESLDFAECNACRACVDACPGNAIGEDGTVDARRCLSYWTIEAPDGIWPDELTGKCRSLFGCDVCTQVCPKRRPTTTVLDPGPEGGLDSLELDDLETTTDEQLSLAIRGTALERTGVLKLRRNARAL